MQVKRKTLFLTQFSMILALEAIVCFTPLGSLPTLGPIVATLMMVPVVIAGIALGAAAGAAMGAFAGLFSFIVWTYMPPAPPMAFLFTPAYSFGELRGNFWSLVICFVPRILSGAVAFLVYVAVSKKSGGQKTAYAAGGAIGSLTNTFGVLGGIFLFFGNQYAGALSIPYETVLAVLGAQVLTSGIPEAILAAVAAVAVCGALRRLPAAR